MMVPALKPHLMELSFDTVKLWRHSDDSSAGAGMDGLMPMTEGEFQEPGQLEVIEPTAGLLHTVAAVYHAPRQQPAGVVRADAAAFSAANSSSSSSSSSSGDAMADDGGDGFDDDDEFAAEAAEARALATANIAGFVVIQKVNLERRTLTVLAPCPGMLPSLNLVIGRDIKWMES